MKTFYSQIRGNVQNNERCQKANYFTPAISLRSRAARPDQNIIFSPYIVKYMYPLIL